jgi:hypothetical protein
MGRTHAAMLYDHGVMVDVLTARCMLSGHEVINWEDIRPRDVIADRRLPLRVYNLDPTSTLRWMTGSRGLRGMGCHN